LIRRSAALLTASAVLLAAGAAGTAAAAPADPAPLLLRLPDLGPGYVITKWGSSDRSCAVLPTASVGWRRVLGSGRSRGCHLAFEQVWTPPGTAPGPGGVQSYAFTFDTTAGPTAALARPRTLPGFFRRRDLRIVEPAPQIGDQAVLMRFHKTTLGLHVSAGIVLWRSGSVLGMVIAATLRRGDADARAAVRLAALQQARIASPTPLRSPVNDDRFVALDDPTLHVPELWLGEQLPAHGRFPELDLRATDRPFSLFGGPQPLVQMRYGTAGLPASVTVELWRPGALRRLLRRPLDRDRCRRRFDGRLDGGRATILATYRRKHGRCPQGDARYTALAFFSDVGVWIGASGRAGVDPYKSRVGMLRLLRALRLREPRPLPAPAP
jgi:hypothetical protein